MREPQIFNGPRGLKIIFCRNSQNLSVSLLLLVKAGTDLETKNKNGIFHFIEHLYFKGTQKYPSAKILMEAIDRIGGSYNAFTSYKYTGYYIKVLPNYLFEALDILSEMILAPLFPEEEIEKERKVIFEEINLYQDTPSSLVIDLGNRLVFGDQPAGWPILGTKETVATIKRSDIIKTIKDNYTTHNTILVISGNINNQKKIIEFINKKFVYYNHQRPKLKFNFRQENYGYKEKIYYRKVEQGHIFLGFPLPGINEVSEKRFIFSLISLILGGKSSSRLWLKIREELGAAYYIASYFSDYLDRSLFFIHAGLNLERLENVLTKLVEELIIFRDKGPTEEELKTAKAVFKSNILMDLEESLGTAFFYGRQYIMRKKFLTPKEVTEKINKITIDNINQYLKNLFNFNQLKFVIIVPPKIKVNFLKIFKKLLK